MPDLITSTNPNTFTPSMVCITGIALMGDAYTGLYFGEEAFRTSLLHQQNVKTTPGPPRGVLVRLVRLVHPDPP